MVWEIRNKILDALEEAFGVAEQNNRDSLILYLVGGEWNSLYEGEKFKGAIIKPTPYMIDDSSDLRRDVSRGRFLCRYMDRRYSKDNFKYEGEDGIDDLNIELMIYTHIWESEWFLKRLYRIASIVSGDEYYVWSVQDGRKLHGKNFIEDIKKKIKDPCPLLYELIKKSYASYLRDSFAHSLYEIDIEYRRLFLYCDYANEHWECSNMSFEEFQGKFVYSVELYLLLQEAICKMREGLAVDEDELRKPIKLPDGRFIGLFRRSCFEGLDNMVIFGGNIIG